MFNQLTGGEAPIGAERVRHFVWRGPRMVYLAVLLVLAAIVTLCVYPSGHAPAVRPCQATTSAHVSAHGPVGNAYADTKQ